MNGMEQWTDENYLDLDPGIRRAVKVMRECGVETFESCQGGQGHAYAEPSVRFYGSDGAGWHALQVIIDHGLPVSSLSRVWTFDSTKAAIPHGPYWQVTFFAPKTNAATALIDAVLKANPVSESARGM